MRVLLIAAVAALATSPTFAGMKYGNDLGCAGIGSSVDVPTEERSVSLEGRYVNFGEYVCEIPNAAAAGKVNMVCAGEGDQWNEVHEITRNADGSISLKDEQDAFTLRLCPSERRT